MNILTDEEIKKVHDADLYLDFHDIARAIESAVLSKLAEQSGAPVATVVISTNGMFAGIKRNLVLHQDAPILFDGDKLYTENQLLAAQQRTAEACAKAVERLISGDGLCADDGVWIHDCAEAIRNEDWRECL